MSAWVNMVPALAGVVVGAAASYLSNALSERARWRRGHSVRWDEARLEAYAAYGDPLSHSMLLASRVAAARGHDKSVHPLDPEAGLQQLAELEADRGRRWQKILLLATPETVEAGRPWHQAVWRLVWFVRGLNDGSDNWSDAYGQAIDRRDAFYARARHDLGVTSGAIPAQPPWPLDWMNDLPGSGPATDLRHR
jgi:hypothetical protein